jgi:hypothetical protein
MPCAHRAEKWTRFSALSDALLSNGEHRMDPKSGVHFWVRCAHRAEKWTRFSALSDALLQRKSIGWIPKVKSTTVFKRYRDWVKAAVFERLFEACRPARMKRPR